MNTATPNAWLPAPLRKLAGRALETALNHTLSLDPDTQHRLAALN
ncbi:MAG TPA: sterol-binding protein, partial [Rhodanobacter sp.]